MRTGVILVGAATLVSVPWTAAAKTPPPASADTTRAADSTSALVQNMTVEGEDRIQIEFERPALAIDLDPRAVSGLDRVDPLAILDRSRIDPTAMLVNQSAFERSPYLARPWMDPFASGSIARFRPAVDGVDRWQLNIADSRGRTVASYEGRGKPPEEIGWDGRSSNGDPAPPGLTYSYVFEAHDRAGNKRSFVGEGFELPSYRISTGDSLFLLCAAKELHPGSPVIAAAAMWLNQLEPGTKPIRVCASARTFGEANELAQRVVRDLEPRLLGDPARMQPVTDVQAGAPEGGVITIVTAR